MKYIDIYDTLSQRYEILDLNEKPFLFGLTALEKANDERLTDKAWELYLVLLPNWESKDRLGFGDFLNKLKRGNSVSSTEQTISKDDLDRYADLADLKSTKV